MNIQTLHPADKEVSAKPLFKGEIGSAIAIQLHDKGILKEHITKTPALLLCIVGKVSYQDEKGENIELTTGDYVNILPNVKHWLKAQAKSQLILLK